MKPKDAAARQRDHRLRQIAAFYEVDGSAAGVAERLGLSKQRASVLLKQADARGYCDYVPTVRATIEPDDVREALRETGSIVAAAARLGVSSPTLTGRFPQLVEEYKAQKLEERGVPESVRRERSKYKQQRRAEAKAKGKCTMCLRRAARRGRLTCRTCSDAAVERRDRLAGKL